MLVSVRNLRKQFDSVDGEVAALQGVSFDIREGDFYTLLGPSGCGKSTTLRCIAGLENPDDGEIWIDGQRVAARGFSVPPNERPIGMVFQSYAIWPHMTVFKNVAFPLKQRRAGVPRAEREARVMEALSLVQMESMAHRPAPFLSGGQQQRVALARAIVLKPKLLLLDEPLSNLDAKLREDLRIELKELTSRLGITTLYVTHDQVEALAMSDRIAVMYGGRILQEAGPRDLYLRPATNFVAQFVGQVNFLDGILVERPSPAIGVVETQHGRIRCSASDGLAVGSSVSVAVRPENVTVSRQRDGGSENVMQGKVEKAMFLGEMIDCQVAVGSQTLRA
jgi:iron(III) transport system ATP-binding protein